VIKHIKEKFDVEYSVSNTYCILRKLGFSRRIPRSRHPKAADEPIKEKFKREVAETAKKNPEHKVVPVDATSLIVGAGYNKRLVSEGGACICKGNSVKTSRSHVWKPHQRQLWLPVQ